MTLLDVMNMPQLVDPQVSPDGKQILFVQSRADWKANRRMQHVWRVNVDGSGLTQMTDGTDGENTPLWSPDGKTIAFLAKRGTTPESVIQLLVMPANGGEGRAVTTHPTAVTNPVWAPNGATLYFRSFDAKPEDQKKREKLKDDVIRFDEDYQQMHLWSVDVAKGSERRLTGGDFSVMAYELSQDGREIAEVRAPSPCWRIAIAERFG